MRNSYSVYTFLFLNSKVNYDGGTTMPGIKLLSPQYFGRVMKIKKEINTNSKDILMDLGCGSGDHLLELNLPKDLTYMGIDYSKKEIMKIRKLKNIFKKFHLIIADAQHLPFKSNSINVLISSDVLEHVDDDRKAFSEMQRIMRHNSKAYITVASSSYPIFYDPINYILEKSNRRPKKFGVWGWGHKRLYKKTDLNKILKTSGFENIEISFINHDISALAENYIGYILMNSVFKNNNSENFKFLINLKYFTKTIYLLDSILLKDKESGTSLFAAFDKR